MSREVSATIEDGQLVIRLPLNRPPYPESSTGKTLVVASTHGNARTGTRLTANDLTERELIVGVNAYIYKEAR